MSGGQAVNPAGIADMRQRLADAVAHLDHVLPAQAPILNFVHHNTLHGYQHLPFTDALDAAERITGIHGYLPESTFRRFHAAGRIDDSDLNDSLKRHVADTDRPVLTCADGRCISRHQIHRIALIHGIDGIGRSQMQWQIDENAALSAFQADLRADAREALLAEAGTDSAQRAVGELWAACLQALGIDDGERDPEDLPADSSYAADDELLTDAPSAAMVCRVDPATHGAVRAAAADCLSRLLGEVGEKLTLRGLLLSLTGTDLLDDIRPMLIRFCASHLDEGLAAWRSPDRSQGLYAAWRRCAQGDLSLDLAGMAGWREALACLPEQSLDAVMHCLNRMRIPQNQWEGYLERLALEIPGWSGQINWRQQRADYAHNRESPASLMDYLAIRLFLDSLWIERLCRDTWGIAGNLHALRRYFENNLSELFIRDALFRGDLPEYLAAPTQRLIGMSWAERGHHENWRNLADRIWRSRQTAVNAPRHTAHGSGWRLFRLAQHLGLPARQVAALSGDQLDGLFAVLDELTRSERGYLWLCAYERHYRQDLFHALDQNRGRWKQRTGRPQSQIIFCMDDREESLRRHIEELNPAVETLGVAGFFGVAMNWRGLDDTQVTPLCPVVVTPAHELREQARPGNEHELAKHRRRRQLTRGFSRIVNQEARRNLVSSHALMDLLAPFVFGLLLGKTFFPRLQDRLVRWLRATLLPDVRTQLALSAANDSPPATPQAPRLGFTDAEQADRVAALLRNIGLTSDFAPIVMICGHGSISQNNPHLAAYDCGACSGRHGGPNARAFAAMANRPVVRALVAERGIDIPADTWFIGGEHNTCNEDLLWFDLDDVPAASRPALAGLQADLAQAALLSAHERCRRLASAPRRPSLRQAMAHVTGRAADFSQARPELGHATNAAAVIGRRSLTRGAFFDRRVFLISYDPTIDADGRILEGILLAAGPVGAGINLEYYFSTVNNERYGCGSKVPHNVTGLFAVMEGASSDLRTGLPQQMVEIHEAMRLQVVVEASCETLSAIYLRQPPLRELIGNGWLLLSAIDPDSGVISMFEPGQGFIEWTADRAPLPRVGCSADWYAGHFEPRPPALIGTEPEPAEAVHAR